MSKARSGGLDSEAARGVLLFSKTAAISAIPLFLDAHAGSLKVIPVNLKGNLDMGKRLEAQFKKKKKRDFLLFYFRFQASPNTCRQC